MATTRINATKTLKERKLPGNSSICKRGKAVLAQSSSMIATRTFLSSKTWYWTKKSHLKTS